MAFPIGIKHDLQLNARLIKSIREIKITTEIDNYGTFGVKASTQRFSGTKFLIK